MAAVIQENDHFSDNGKGKSSYCTVQEKAMVDHSCIFIKKTVWIENIDHGQNLQMWLLRINSDSMANNQLGF